MFISDEDWESVIHKVHKSLVCARHKHLLRGFYDQFNKTWDPLRQKVMENIILSDVD